LRYARRRTDRQTDRCTETSITILRVLTESEEVRQRSLRSSVKLEFHDADTDTDTNILVRIFADTSDARFPEVIPVARSTTRRHSRNDPREDVGEEVHVGVGVRVGAVECQL